MRPTFSPRFVFLLQCTTTNGIGRHSKRTNQQTVWVILACIIHVLSWSGRWFIYEPLADARMKGKSPTWDHKACQKFSETMTCNVFFIISASLGCRVIWPKHWSTSSVAWTDNIDDWSLPGDYKFFYILYGARFTSDLISIFFENRPRGTFLLSFAHHVVTISLVLLTATANFTEFAGVVMFYFDWADPLLLSAKACRYMSLESDGLLNTISDRLFELFAVVFIFTRGVIYNFIVYVACRDGPQTPLGIGGKALLIILAFMQTYWIGLIIKAALIKKTTGKLEDIQNKEKKET